MGQMSVGVFQFPGSFLHPRFQQPLVGFQTLPAHLFVVVALLFHVRQRRGDGRKRAQTFHVPLGPAIRAPTRSQNKDPGKPLGRGEEGNEDASLDLGGHRKIHGIGDLSTRNRARTLFQKIVQLLAMLGKPGMDPSRRTAHQERQFQIIRQSLFQSALDDHTLGMQIEEVLDQHIRARFGMQ